MNQAMRTYVRFLISQRDINLGSMNYSRKRLFCGWQTSAYSLRYLSSEPESSNPKQFKRKTFEEQGEWTSKFSLFSPRTTGEGIFIRMMRAPIDLRPEAIARWWERKKEEAERLRQMFIQERHETLGNDLATAHFILYRGGKVKFRDEAKWYAGQKHNLPTKFTPGYDLEAVDASDVNIYYEGFYNFVGLKYLKSLSLRNCNNVDDWCLDYISGELQTLEYLDLHNCQNVTENGLACLYRLHKLKYLNVSNIPQTKHFELTCLLLEDTSPGLKVEGVKYLQV